MGYWQRQIRATGKFVIFSLVVLYYLGSSYLYRAFVWNNLKRKEFHARNVSQVTRWACACMAIQRTYLNPPPPDRQYLFLGNHLGFLDIFILSSMRPTLFVTSVEMRETPFLGLMCELGGCLFVERRSRKSLVQEISEIRSLLKDGFSIAIYPEGTSGDGSRILPFKKSLLTAATESGVPLKVMVINYLKVNGQKVDHGWREYVFWYGDLQFFPSLWRIFTLQSIEVELSFHEEIHVSAKHDRREVAAKAQAIVEKHYVPVPFPAGHSSQTSTPSSTSPSH